MAESRQHLDRARSCLRRLRDGTDGAQAVAEAFRHAHSLKGMAATLGHDAMATSADELENLLESLQRGAAPSEGTLDAIDRAVDAIEQGIEEPAEARGEARAGLVPFAAIEEGLIDGVRDLAERQGKAVQLTVSGGDLSLDRALIDSLCEPLLHLLLNALDHGIEPPAERAIRRKPEAGSIEVRLERHADGLHLSVADDGRGIDEREVRRRAVDEGWLSEQEAARLDPRALTELLTRAGFSTSRGDSPISGRGIGLDAVRDATERLGGELTIDSRPGRGTTVTLALPAAAL